MKNDSGSSKSVWMSGIEMPARPALSQSKNTQVCIVGAGMAGLSAAYFLCRQGKSVVVLDDGPISGGETCRTTAHLANAFDDRYFAVEQMHGEDAARLVAESHTAAIDVIEEIVRAEAIECSFERLDGYLFLAKGHTPEMLRRELEAAHRAGLTSVEWLDISPLSFFDIAPCLRFPRQGQFHPLKYLSGLAKAVLRMGGEIYTQTHVTKVEGGEPARIETRNGVTVLAEHVIVATNSPVNDRVAIHTKQAPYRTYVIGARIPAGSVPKALFWDTADPYHYIRLHRLTVPSEAPGEDFLIIGGEDHKTAQPSANDAPFANLESWARDRFPTFGQVEYRWSGQVLEPVDYLAFIGKNPMDSPNVYIATGDSGQGMTHGTIAGILLTDMISGRENRWAKVYDPSRKTLRALPEFTRENFNVAARYTDWVLPGEVQSTDEIPAGMGAIIRRGMAKIAVFRDEHGSLHERSAVCRHLGCVVQWNPVEKTWDCPCHGSRFSCLGEVINGPAISALAPVEPAEPERKTKAA